MNLTGFSREKLFAILISRIVIFFFVMCLLTLFLYAAGTAQNFIDSTQFFLLNLYSFLGVMLTASSACGAIMDLRRFIRSKKVHHLFWAFGYLLLAILGVASFLFITAILAISGAKGL